MAEPSGRAILERFARALESKDFDAQDAMLTDDYPGGVGTVESDRLVGAEDKWLLTPSFNVLRIEGSGDVYTYVGTVRYANGETWQMISIVELRDGKIAKVTLWYAAPFEAPEWRAPYVERYESPLKERG